MVGAIFFLALYVGGTVFYGFTAIFEPIQKEMGWSYTQISFAFSLRGVEFGLLSPVLGFLVDRWGARRIMVIAVLTTSLGLMLLSRVDSLGMFYASFVLIIVGTSCSSISVIIPAIANWFRRRLGLATGIIMSGYASGGLLVSLLVKLIDMYGWRGALVIQGTSMLVICLPVALLLRHKPEQYGYLPDGDIAPPVSSNGKDASASETSITSRQALKNPTFWALAITYTMHAVFTSTVVSHIMPYLSSIGMARVLAGFVATVWPLFSIGGRLSFGWLGDKFNRRVMSAVCFLMMVLGFFSFGYAGVGGFWLLLVFIPMYGAGSGGSNTLRAAVVREYFGREHFGAIFGLVIGINMLGNVVGPAAAGWVYDTWGSYQGVWYVLAGLSLASALSLLLIVSSHRPALAPVLQPDNHRAV